MTYRRSSMGCLILGRESLINLALRPDPVSLLSQALKAYLARRFISCLKLSHYLVETVSLSHTYIPKV